MGLDLFHIVPSALTNNTLDYLTESDFDSNPEFWRRYSNLHSVINDYDFDDFEILIYPDTETKRIVSGLYGWAQKTDLIGEVAALESQILQIATANQMANRPSLTLKHIDNVLTEQHKREIFYHTIAYKVEKGSATVLYYTEKGYQRKGMHPSFYKDFENCKVYFELADVIKAFSYIHSIVPGRTEELRKSFTQNFVDNFIEGESMFMASW
ncbi:MAG: hypothetical protein RLZZ367_25 [Bacteroidota bacterium]|jgi:hypothetical protein